jgi:hypothetical protein
MNIFASQLTRTIIFLSAIYYTSALITPTFQGRTAAPVASSCRTRIFVPSASIPKQHAPTLLLLAKRDSSRAGTKRGRLDKLAEREEEMIETDKGVVLKAAGGFVGLIVVLLIAAAAGGVFDELFLKAM